MKTSIDKFIPLSLLILLLACPFDAIAQDCQDLENNKEWIEGMQYVKNATQTKAYDKALQKLRALVQICPDSPMLNYYIFVALDQKDDKIKALQYIQKASENTFLMATAPEASRKIWYARHDAEYPERTESALAELTLDNTNKTAALQDAQIALHEDHAIGLWTGVGLGAAGLALIATGATLALWDDVHYHVQGKEGLVFTEDESEQYFTSRYTYEENQTYIWGVSLASIGAAFLVSGTILSAVFGYKYSRSKNNIDYAFSVSPNHLSFNLSF